MAKYQDIENPCPYVIFPCGKGVPLCLRSAVEEKKLATIKIQDLEDCERSKCPVYEKHLRLAAM